MSLNSVLMPAAVESDRTLVVLHGRGDSHQGFLWLQRALGFQALNVRLVDAPDRYYTGLSWYDLPPNQRPGVERSVRELEALFDRWLAEGLDPAKTALLGFSQGCLMTLEWGARSSIELAAYVGISGYCLDPASLIEAAQPHIREPNWLVTHGHFDAVLPFSETEQQVAWLQSMGWPIRFEAYDKEHTIDPVDELPLIRSFLAERLALT